jgi:hypothetical protein
LLQGRKQWSVIGRDWRFGRHQINGLSLGNGDNIHNYTEEQPEVWDHGNGGLKRVATDNSPLRQGKDGFTKAEFASL